MQIYSTSEYEDEIEKNMSGTYIPKGYYIPVGGIRNIIKSHLKSCACH